MRKWYLISLLGIFLSYEGVAQLGGEKSYEFLTVSGNARLSGLGGVNVSLANKDVNFFLSNPALVTDSLNGFAAASYMFYVADIGQAAFAYANRFKKIGTIMIGVQHMGYGEIMGYDPTGSALGSYQSGETALVIGKSHRVSAFTLGANLKAVFSSLAGFRSSAVLLDLGGTFHHPTQDLTIGLAIKNFGFVLSDYSETSATEIPFDMQAGVTFKPAHMPLRFSITAYNLVRLGNAYDNEDDADDDTGGFNKVMQHFNFGAEVLLHKNVTILLGYNVLRRQELKTDTQGSGITFGASVKIKAVDVVFSRSSYSVGNAAYTFTIAANLNKMFFKRRAL